MILLGSKSSSNILIKKRVQTGKETNKLKIREQQTRDNRHPASISDRYISGNREHELNLFPETVFILHTTTSGTYFGL